MTEEQKREFWKAVGTLHYEQKKAFLKCLLDPAFPALAKIHMEKCQKS